MSAGLYLSHPACLEHDPRRHSPGHPDTPDRLVALEAALAARDWFGWERRRAPRASEAQLELVHSPQHVRALAALCAAGGGAIDADTYVGEASYVAALHAAGAATEMTRSLLAGEHEVGFCAVRPSGHHAEAARAMGFCLFNNVAVAAASAIAELGLRRVFVLDWDVHHGNGSAAIFAQRSDVLFASIHQTHLYPGSGALAECGSGAGEGYTINVPVPPGCGEALWLTLIDRVILPAARSFQPQLVLVSAGFDAHADDPLAHCELRHESFAQMASRVRELGRFVGAPVGVVLEGGYNARALADCVCATLPALAGEGAARHPGELEQRGDRLLGEALAQHGRHWPV